MKASYKDSMQNVVFGESEKAKIRRVILATTVPVKQRSNILHWKYMIVIAAVFLAGAGIYKSVKLSWENEQYRLLIIEHQKKMYQMIFCKMQRNGQVQILTGKLFMKLTAGKVL